MQWGGETDRIRAKTYPEPIRWFESAHAPLAKNNFIITDLFYCPETRQIFLDKITRHMLSFGSIARSVG